MSNITYRLVKGKELTFEEIDQNFSSLDSDIRANRRYFDSQLEVFGLGRDSDFLEVLAQRDSDAAAIILSGIARHDSDVGALHSRIDSEHAWNISQHDQLQSDIDSEHAWNISQHNQLQNDLQSNIDSVNLSLINKTDSLNLSLINKTDSLHGEIVSINDTVSNGNVTLANSFTVQGLTFDGSASKTLTFLPGNGISLSSSPDNTSCVITNDQPNTDTTYTAGVGLQLINGTEFVNLLPDQTVSFVNGTGISVTGTYPNFTVTNTSPDQTVSLTGSGATSVTGTYPNFTVSSTNTTYTAGTGLSLVGTEFRNAAPDQTVSLSGTGGITITGTYPSFTIDASGAQGATYTAGNGLTLDGTTFKMSGSYTGTFTATGDVVAYSDVALKSEVNAIDQALEKLMAITGYTYKKEGSDRRYSGVMAQDVEKVLPEVVHTSEDGIKGVAYGNMMGLVIEAIRELKTQVEELKSR